MMSQHVAPMACKPWTLNGLSDELIVSHYENNYGSAVRALNSVRDRLASLELETVPAYELRSLKREELAAMGSVALHEVYFDSLGGDGAVLFTGVGGGSKMPQPMAAAIEQQFGSLASWKREFVALARALEGGPGWVVLSYSRHDGGLHNQVALTDSQSLADGVPLLGAIIICAWVIPDVVAGFIWNAFLAGGPQSVLSPGLLNSVMSTFALPQHSWIQEYPLTMVIIANIWRGTAFSMLLYASALEGIPSELLEAASIDGAGIWARLRHITLPLIKGSIATDLLLITLATLSDFTLVYVMTGGSNLNNELLTIYQYRQAFQFYQIGYGSAIALLIIVVGAILSLIYIRILRVDI